MRTGIEFLARHAALLRLLAEHGALRTGAMAGRSDYLRFIVVTRTRTGWHLLRSALNTHSQIVVLGELFKNPETVVWRNWPYHYVPAWYGRRLSSLIRSDPIRFLETRVFRTYPATVRAVGFKIGYSHARESPWKPVWPYLEKQKNLKVIHLKRRNILKAHLSLVRARGSRIWVSRSGDATPLSPVHLDVEKCLSAFEETRADEVACDRFFADHDSTDVFYEDLFDGYTSEIDRIQAFLGVRIESIEPRTQRLGTGPLSESIENYEELVQRLADTPWEAFLDER